jgi:hypothetical protein
MPFIKQFRTHQVRVPDPLHPGKRAFEDRLIDCGGSELSGPDGVHYFADEDGWFDVPSEVADHLLKMRHPNGERFYRPEDVDVEVRLGRMDPEGALPTEKAAEASPAKRGRPRKTTVEQ